MDSPVAIGVKLTSPFKNGDRIFRIKWPENDMVYLSRTCLVLKILALCLFYCSWIQWFENLLELPAFTVDPNSILI
jgi:hypothetical protein